MVRDHVAGKPDSSGPAPFLEVEKSLPATDSRRDLIAFEGVGRGFGIRVAAEILDALGCRASFPETDEPQGSETGILQTVQLLVGNLVQTVDVSLVFLGQLVKPDQCALCIQLRSGVKDSMSSPNDE